MRHTHLLMTFVALSACSASDSNHRPPSETIDPEIQCKSEDCGQTRFRRVVPSRDTVRIQFHGAARRIISPEHEHDQPTTGRISLALESQSSALVDTQNYVGEINEVVDGIFERFEELAATSPEEQTDLLHIWRQESADDPTLDELLVVTSIDDTSYAIELLVGPTGVSPQEGKALISGEVKLDSNEEKANFELTLDLDAFAAVFEDFHATGDIVLSARPFDAGIREVWYDFHEVAFDADEQSETSLTTYWIFDANDGALEYISEIRDEEATVYVRWDDDGGRFDRHVQWAHDEVGLVDEIYTNCWGASGAELFTGTAVIDRDLSYYGEIDGVESDCIFGPVDGHPDPTEEFDNLPGEGEWDDLEFEADDIVEECDPKEEECSQPLCELEPSDPDCLPFCENDPSAPDCVPWCDDEPSDPSCEDYCDWVNDPDYCDEL